MPIDRLQDRRLATITPRSIPPSGASGRSGSRIRTVIEGTPLTARKRPGRYTQCSKDGSAHGVALKELLNDVAVSIVEFAAEIDACKDSEITHVIDESIDPKAATYLKQKGELRRTGPRRTRVGRERSQSRSGDSLGSITSYLSQIVRALFLVDDTSGREPVSSVRWTIQSVRSSSARSPPSTCISSSISRYAARRASNASVGGRGGGVTFSRTLRRIRYSEYVGVAIIR